MRGGEIRTALHFAVVARVRFYTKRGPGTSYRFLNIGTLRDMLIGLFQEADPRKLRRNSVAVARDWQRLLDNDDVPSRAALSRELGVSRAHVTQVLGLLSLSLEEQEAILALGDPLTGKGTGIRTLRNLASLKTQERLDV